MEPLYTVGREEMKRVSYTLAGRKVQAIISSYGELSVPLYRYGPVMDYGGIWSRVYRFTGPIAVSVGGKSVLETAVEARYYPWGLEVVHNANGSEVVEKIFPAVRDTLAFLTFEGDAQVRLVGISWLAPNMALACVPERLRTASKGEEALAISDGRYSLGVATDRGRVRLLTDGEASRLRFRGEIPRRCFKAFEIVLEGGGSIAFSAVRGGPKRAIKVAKHAVEEVEQYFKERKEHFSRALSRAPQIELPDSKVVRAFKAAVVALEMLKAELPDGSVGVSAGFPWFTYIWGRDLAWSLFGLMALGDLEWVERSVESILRYQAKHDIKLLDAERGRVPHTIHGNLPPLYTSVDAPLYYPILVERLAEAKRDWKVLKKFWRAVERVVEWGARRDVDGDGLIETRPGKNWPTDGTWMDTENRSEKPVDVEALWVATLRSAENIFKRLGKRKEAEQASKLREQAERSFSKLWSGEFFYDTIRPDGKPDLSVRPNALVPVIFGVADDEKGKKVVRRLTAPDMLTEWGLRSLSSEDPRYSPEIYQRGMVWGLTTGWLALAAFRAGLPEEGYRALSIMASRISEEKGMYAEVYLGDKAEPHHSCVLQAWNMALYVWSVVEGLFGLSVRGDTYRISPAFPEAFEAEAKISVNGVEFIISPAARKVTVRNGLGKRIRVETPKEIGDVGPGERIVLNI